MGAPAPLLHLTQGRSEEGEPLCPGSWPCRTLRRPRPLRAVHHCWLRTVKSQHVQCLPVLLFGGKDNHVGLVVGVHQLHRLIASVCKRTGRKTKLPPPGNPHAAKGLEEHEAHRAHLSSVSPHPGFLSLAKAPLKAWGSPQTTAEQSDGEVRAERAVDAQCSSWPVSDRPLGWE